MLRRYSLFLLLLASVLGMKAQQYFTLQPSELQIDSVLPHFAFVQPLGPHYGDSVYEVSLEYPEFAPMKRSEVRRYKKIAGDALPSWPVIDSYVGVSRRQGSLYTSFVPFVRRDGKNMKMTGFKLVVKGRPKPQAAVHHAPPAYASSPFIEGRWVKMSIPSTGYYELSDSLLQAAGFDDIQKVKVYGYGGQPQPEKLTADYVAATDVLSQVPVAEIGGRRVFYGEGPVGWATPATLTRTLNPYSRKGYYFLSDNETEHPLLVDADRLTSSYYPSPYDYHSLYEVDDYAWYHGGRNLYDRRLFGRDVARSYVLPAHASSGGTISVTMSYKGYCDATVAVGDSLLGHILVDETTTKGAGRKQFLDTYSKAAADVWTFPLDSIEGDCLIVTIRQLSGADMRLDNIVLTFKDPRPLPDLTTAVLAEPSIEGAVAPQNRHADTAVDMVIIIPPSGKLLEQAERLAALHETYDSMRVRVVRADELYNEFSGGTPDVNAYRRYLKMLYDRAQTEADMPRYLLLFGDGAYDNRMLTSNFSQLDPADFLLCYESENSLSETACYVCDDYFGLLDDGEGGDLVKSDKVDVGVGRFPARTIDEAKVLVDKAYSYRLNEHPGSWQNIICFMGDDGNANMHMNDAETVSSQVSEQWPAYHIKKIYWDAYQRTSSTTGYAYPDVSRLIRQQMREGALLMNYTGHGAANTLSHEYVVGLDDFKASTSLRLPMWFTASCDVAPFDGHEENIGEQAMFNPNGGAIAFLGTTRTVYALHNRSMNRSFMKHILSLTDGRRNTIGDAVRMAKNDQVKGISTQTQAGINKMHFALLGDPALQLAFPVETVVVDSINGQAVDHQTPHLIAGDTATVKGHIKDCDHFQGVVTLTVKDAEEVIVCRLNPQAQDEMPKSPLVYRDRPGTLFEGSDSVRSGKFTVTFAVPKDISYSDDYGQMLLYAVDDTRQVTAHGFNEHFTMGSAEDYENAGEGPIIHAWLDAPDFVDGAVTAAAPTFHADLYDEDGVNVSGSGIGHDLELVVDGLMRYTFNLNSYFHYDFGDYRSGSLDFTLPTLAEGTHELFFRAWDVLNHSSEFRTTFVVGTAGSPSGISDVLTDADTAEAYDLQGRRFQQGSSQRSTLILYRTLSGKMKKKLMKGNK